jgi:hypothetical protein
MVISDLHVAGAVPVAFEARATGGATPLNVQWGISGSLLNARRAPGKMSEVRSAAVIGYSTCAPGLLECKDEVLQPYVRNVTAIVDDSLQSCEVAITVIPCKTGKPLLDDPYIRQIIRESWLTSGADQEKSSRRENLWAIYEHVSTNELQGIPMPNPRATPCEVDSVSLTAPDTLIRATDGSIIWKLKTFVHPHPLVYGDTWPNNCTQTFRGGTYLSTPYPGGLGKASISDWQTSTILNVPGIMVDFEGIYFFDGRGAKYDTTTFPVPIFDFTNMSAGGRWVPISKADRDCILNSTPALTPRKSHEFSSDGRAGGGVRVLRSGVSSRAKLPRS